MLLWRVEFKNLAGEYYPPIRYSASLEIADNPAQNHFAFDLVLRRQFEGVETTPQTHHFNYHDLGASRLEAIAQAVAMSQLWLQGALAARADIEATLKLAEGK